MDCELIQPELPAFHFGEAGEVERAAVEGHLGSCPRCLRGYFAIKAALEQGGGKPSTAARERLRQSVARAVQRSPSKAPRRTWERPVAFMLACSGVVLATLATGALASRPGSPPHGWTASRLP